jgi:uncharacterized protein
MPDSPITTPTEPWSESVFRRSQLPFTLLRVGLYLILTEVISYALILAAQPFLARESSSPVSPELIGAGDVIALCSTFPAAWIMSRLEKRRFGEYGLPLRSAFGKLFWQGALFGAVEISTVIGAMAVLGYYHFGPIELHGGTLFRWAFFWLALFVVVGLYEEFAFRGYVQFTLGQGMTFWPAAVFLSVMFGVRHLNNPGETWPGIAGVILSGLFWCFTLRRSGSLWFAVGMHASFDFGETFVYSVPDSGMLLPGHLSSATLAGPTWLCGGTAGPEASIFDFLVLLIFFYVFHRLYPAVSRSDSQAAESPRLADAQ